MNHTISDSEVLQIEQLKTVLAEERLKQWHPPVTKYPSVQEVYYKRLLKVHGEDDEEVGPSARAEREITALIRRWPPHKLHVMYLEQCAKFTVPEEEIESEYVPPPPPPPQYTRPIPKNRTVQWEYRKRMIDLYTRKGHLVRAENVDIEMLDYRGKVPGFKMNYTAAVVLAVQVVVAHVLVLPQPPKKQKAIG